MKPHNLAIANVQPLAHILEALGLYCEVVIGFGTLEELPEILMTDGELLEVLLGPAPVMTKLEEDGNAGEKQEGWVSQRVLVYSVQGDLHKLSQG